jgi:DtxR family Mn-dependent transcriptional regulator
LGHPTHDPHGEPIPDAGLTLPDEPCGRRLAEVTGETELVVVRVTSQEREILHSTALLGLKPGARFTIVGHANGVELLDSRMRRIHVPSDLASNIWVEEIV